MSAVPARLLDRKDAPPLFDVDAERLERMLMVLDLRRKKVGWITIAGDLGISVRMAQDDYELILKRAALERVEQQRREMAADLEELMRKAWEVLDANHVVVSQGHVVSEIIGQWPMIDVDGNPMMMTDRETGELVRNPFSGQPHKNAGQPIYGDALKDSAPKLAAIETLRKLNESYRKLFGVDSAIKIDQNVSVNFTIDGVSPADLS